MAVITANFGLGEIPKFRGENLGTSTNLGNKGETGGAEIFGVTLCLRPYSFFAGRAASVASGRRSSVKRVR